MNQSNQLQAALRTLLANGDLCKKSAQWLGEWQMSDSGYLPVYIWRWALERIEKYEPLRPLFARSAMPARGNGRPALETDGVALMLLRRKIEGLPLGENVPFGQFLVRRIMTEGGVRWRVFEGEVKKTGREHTALDVLLKLQEVRA